MNPMELNKINPNREKLYRRGRNRPRQVPRAGALINPEIEKTLSQLQSIFPAAASSGLLNPVNTFGVAFGLLSPEDVQRDKNALNRVYNFPLYSPEAWKIRHDQAYSYLRNKLAAQGRLNELPPYLTEEEVETIEKERRVTQEPELRAVSDQEWKWFQKQRQPSLLDRARETLNELYWNPTTRPLAGLAKLGAKVFDMVFGGTSELIERFEGGLKPVRAADALWTSLELAPVGKAAYHIKQGVTAKKAAANEIAQKAAAVDVRKPPSLELPQNTGASETPTFKNINRAGQLKLRKILGRMHVGKGDVVDLIVPDLNRYGVQVSKAAPIVGFRKVATVKGAPLKVWEDADAAKIAYKMIGRQGQENSILVIVDDDTKKVEGVIRLALGDNTRVAYNSGLVANVLANWPGIEKGKKTLYHFHNHPSSIALPSEGDIESSKVALGTISRLLKFTPDGKDLQNSLAMKEGVVDNHGRFKIYSVSDESPNIPSNVEEYFTNTDSVSESLAKTGELPFMERRIVKTPRPENVFALESSMLPYGVDKLYMTLKKNDLLNKPGFILYGPLDEFLAWVPLKGFTKTDKDLVVDREGVLKTITALNAAVGTTNPTKISLWLGDTANPKDAETVFDRLDSYGVIKATKDLLDSANPESFLRSNVMNMEVLTYDPKGNKIAKYFIDPVQDFGSDSPPSDRHFKLNTDGFSMSIFSLVEDTLKLLEKNEQKLKGGG